MLVVGHHVDNLEHGYGGPTSRDVLHDPDAIAATLAGYGLVVERADMVERPVDTDGGHGWRSTRSCGPVRPALG